jgi:hypothetical protein
MQARKNSKEANTTVIKMTIAKVISTVVAPEEKRFGVFLAKFIDWNTPLFC